MALKEIPPRFCVVQRPRLHLLLLLPPELPLVEANKYRPTVHLIPVCKDRPGFLLQDSLLFQRPSALFFMTFCPSVTATSITWQRLTKDCVVEFPAPCGVPGVNLGSNEEEFSLMGKLHYILHTSLCWMYKTKQTKTAAPCQGAERNLPQTVRGKQPCEPSSSLLCAFHLRRWGEGNICGLNRGTAGMAAATVNLLDVQQLFSQRQNRWVPTTQMRL